MIRSTSTSILSATNRNLEESIEEGVFAVTCITG